MAYRSRLAILEESFESLIFWSRWILSPGYVVLVICLVVLCAHIGIELIQLLGYLITSDIFDETKIILQILTIVDLVLVANLVLMVVFVGYTNFVSIIRVRKTEDWPQWINNMDYSGLKLQMLGSIIAIASVKMLRAYISLSDYGALFSTNTRFSIPATGYLSPESRLLWMTAIYAAFLIGALIISIINRLHPTESDEKRSKINQVSDQSATDESPV